jgi:hypothetical protein
MGILEKLQMNFGNGMIFQRRRELPASDNFDKTFVFLLFFRISLSRRIIKKMDDFSKSFI